MAGRAFLGADKFCAWDTRRRENCSGSGTARQQNYSERDRTTGTPQQAFAPNEDPLTQPRTPHEWRLCAEQEKQVNAFFRVLFGGRIRSFVMLRELNEAMSPRRFSREFVTQLD